MKTATVVFAGAMFASMVMAAVSDQSSEERYRAKYGRYTPAQKSRVRDVQAASAATATEPAGPVCCRSWHRHDRLVVSTSISTGDRFRAKYGRSLAVEERDRRSAEEHLAVHRGKCLEIGQCSLMSPKTEASNAVTATSSEEARFVAKYGRIRSVPDPATGIGSAPCEHTCCQHGL